jgi:PAS domain-containing protein
MEEPKVSLKKLIDLVIEGKKLTDSQEAQVASIAKNYWDNHPDVTIRYPRWKKYIAWVAGYQTYDYNKVTKKLVEVPVDRRKGNIQVNKLRPMVKVLLSKLRDDRAHKHVLPATDDYDDIESARAGEKIIEGIQDRVDWDSELEKARLWAILCNCAYFRVFWNEEKEGILGYEQPTYTDDLGNEHTGEESQPIIEEGDVDVETISPFNCRHDPLYTEEGKWRWFIYGEEVSCEEIEEKYDLKRGTVTDVSSTLKDAYELQYTDTSGAFNQAGSKSDSVRGDSTTYMELWTPEVYFFLAGNKVLEYGTHDYGEIPFYKVSESVVPIGTYERGLSYNESPIKDFIPLQREYNRQYSLMSVAIERASKLKVLAPLGAMLNKKQWTNDYGVFIDYDKHKGEPYQMKLDPFPPHVQSYKGYLERDMEDVLNVHPVSMGQLPERASHASGTLAGLLLQQDDVTLTPLIRALNRASGKAWTMVLRLIQKYYSAARLLRYTGEDGAFQVKYFKGADLRGNTDVRITSESGLPKSLPMRVEYIMRLFESGIIQDPQMILEMMEFGQAKKIFKDVQVHERKAHRENELIKSNPKLTTADVGGFLYPLESHMVHLNIHLRERLSAGFERQEKGVQDLMDFHIQKTYEAIQGIQQQQAEQGQPAEEQGGQAPQG